MSISSSTDVASYFAWTGIDELTAGFRSGAFTPVDVARALLDRVQRLNPLVNAVIDLAPQRTLAMAEASVARWKAGMPLSALDGVPVTIKDLSAVKGWLSMTVESGPRIFAQKGPLFRSIEGHAG